MNKIHPAVIVAGAAAGVFAFFAVVRALLTPEVKEPKAITSDIPATPVAPPPQAETVVPAEAPAASGTA